MSRALSCFKKPWLGRIQRRCRTCSIASTTVKLCFIIRYARTSVADLLRPITQCTRTLSRKKWRYMDLLETNKLILQIMNSKVSSESRRTHSVGERGPRGWNLLQAWSTGTCWKWVCHQPLHHNTGFPCLCSTEHQSAHYSTFPLLHSGYV